jgi:anti-sigma28 factor (negative regulator of flagellin synthesis)
MNEVSTIRGLASPATLRVFADQATAHPPRNGEARTGDSVEISELANFLNLLSELPEDRARRIVDVREQIANGTYVTDEKLSVAVDRLVKDL